MQGKFVNIKGGNGEIKWIAFGRMKFNERLRMQLFLWSSWLVICGIWGTLIKQFYSANVIVNVIVAVLGDVPYNSDLKGFWEYISSTSFWSRITPQNLRAITITNPSVQGKFVLNDENIGKIYHRKAGARATRLFGTIQPLCEATAVVCGAACCRRLSWDS